MLKNKISESHQYKLGRIKEILKILQSEKQICFRGGTALSLTYEIIERFSEDIDISIFSGPKKIKAIISSLINKFENTNWINKTKHKQKEKKIELHFKNKKPKPPFSSIFSDNKIIIEYPEKFRSKNDFQFSFISPFKGADFKMNVMSKEHIFADKASILIEKFSKNLDFKWALDEKVQARHLYDVQMLIQKEEYKNVDNKYIRKRIYSVIIKKDQNLRGKDEKFKKSQINFYKKSQKAAFLLFKLKLLDAKEEIEKNLKSIIYPGVNLINLRKFLKNYEPIFKSIFQIIKYNLKMD